MVLVKEFRVLMPMTVEEFQRGQLFTVSEASKEATTGQTAIEILKNEPYDDPIMGKGQYTHKIYHIAGRCPKLIQAIAPTSALKIDERAWNAYPYCKTGERFNLTVESMHLADDGSNPNALKADQQTLAKRKIQKIEIFDPSEPLFKNEPGLDTGKIRSEKTGRGPLFKGWEKELQPLMCCYKLVTTKFKVFGFETKVESMIDQIQHDILKRFFRQVFCLMDQWFDLTINDIRELEEKTKKDLDEKIDSLHLETKQSLDRPTGKLGIKKHSSEDQFSSSPENGLDDGKKPHNFTK